EAGTYGRAVPSYATGGFHVKPHLGMIGDNPEVTLPLSSPAAAPAYRGIADNIMSSMGGKGGGGDTYNFEIKLGENGAIIASEYTVRQLGERVAGVIEQRIRQTGKFSYGAR